VKASTSSVAASRRNRPLIGWRLLVVAVMVVVAMVYTVAFVLVLAFSQLDERQRADAIVVLGAAQYNGWPSPVLRARLEHALALYRERLAPMILVTGGVGRRDKESEAIVARRYLLYHDVPDSAVVVQPQGRSTQASMTAVAGWLAGRGLHSAILVSDPFHMFRLHLEARRTGLIAYTSPTETSPISDNPVLELEYLAAEAVKVPVAWVRSLEWFH
jgi:uncharacterized SAM-binding protein YcdF (DUF218 family)